MELKRKPVILDTDIGTDIDDTWALALIMRSPELELKAATLVSYDTAFRARLTAKLLRTEGHPDIPLGLGPTTSTDTKYNCQQEWLGAFSLNDWKAPVSRDAAEIIIEIGRAHV